MRDALSASERGRYTDLARKLGRPQHPCPCEACSCPLHSYERYHACVWCAKGNHADGDGDAE